MPLTGASLLCTLDRHKHTLPQGALAPVLASASLFGIYLLLKYFPDLRYAGGLECIWVARWIKMYMGCGWIRVYWVAKTRTQI
jgi:hypothetical protein